MSIYQLILPCLSAYRAGYKKELLYMEFVLIRVTPTNNEAQNTSWVTCLLSVNYNNRSPESPVTAEERCACKGRCLALQTACVCDPTGKQKEWPPTHSVYVCVHWFFITIGYMWGRLSFIKKNGLFRFVTVQVSVPGPYPRIAFLLTVLRGCPAFCDESINGNVNLHPCGLLSLPFTANGFNHGSHPHAAI